MTGMKRREIIRASDSEQVVCDECGQLMSLCECHSTTNDTASSPNINPSNIRRAPSDMNNCPGFLGSTSYSAVFTESQNQMGLEGDQEAAGGGEPYQPFALLPQHQRRVRDGVAVLKQLVDFIHLKKLAERWLDHVRGLAMIAPFMPMLIPSIEKDLYEPYIASMQEDALLMASDMLFANSAQPLRVPSPCSIQDFCLLFTGSRLRWESVGMLFTACGLATTIVQPADAVLSFVGDLPPDKRRLSHSLMEASNACVDFCNELGHLNDLGMWLALENCILVSQVLGDANYLTWRRIGDLSTAIFALGLHQEVKSSPGLPLWLTEFRKRCLAVVYVFDKLIATFVGRPPRISARYCSIEVPPDIDFDDLLHGDAHIQKSHGALNAEGWNEDGQWRRSSHTRASVITSLIREDILELSLGPFQVNTLQLGLDIARRNKAAWDAFPKALQYQPDVWNSSKSREQCFFSALLYLEIIYNDFLLQRTLVRRIRANSDELLRISRLLMSALLELISNRHQIGTFFCEVPWVVVLFGLPAAGVLALELLQQSRSYASNNSSSTARAFPRSEIIQNLSVFVSCLGWVHTEGDGNYHLCIQARNMIQRILDKVLSPEPFPSSQQSLPTPSTGFDEAVNFDFSWMDNAEFDADFWSNLPDHPLLALPEDFNNT